MSTPWHDYAVHPVRVTLNADGTIRMAHLDIWHHEEQGVTLTLGEARHVWERLGAAIRELEAGSETE